MALNKVNLASVTSATTGEAVDTRDCQRKTVYVEVTGNTGAVTVTIEHSPDKIAWYVLDSKTYTATNAKDSWSYRSHFPWIRAKTSTQSDSTVKVTITGRDQVAA